MSDFYPPGVTRLPDDEMFKCNGCSTWEDHTGYDPCPNCNEQAVCNSCLYCNSCDKQFKECDCGSGYLVEHGEIECEECKED